MGRQACVCLRLKTAAIHREPNPTAHAKRLDYAMSTNSYVPGATAEICSSASFCMQKKKESKDPIAGT